MNRCGLYNIGWNCYINSALQCLASCNIVDNILTKYSDEDKQIKDILEKYGYSSIPFRQAEFVAHTQKIISQLSLSNNTATGNSTSELDTETQKTLKLLNKIGEKGLKIFIYFEFHDIIKRLRELKKMNIDPRKFIRVLGTTSKPEFAHLFSGQQNDPHEFLMYLFDMLHNSKCEPVDVKINNFDAQQAQTLIPGIAASAANKQSISVSGDKSTEDHHNILRNQVYMDIKRRYEKEYSHIEHDICFYNINSIICSVPQCNHRIFNVTHNNVLYLPIPKISPCSIYDCMNDLFKREYLTDYKCDNCGNRSGNYIDKSIVMHPKLLVFELTRYSSSFNSSGMSSSQPSSSMIYNMLMGGGINSQLRKNSTPVDYPDVLDISKYIYGNDVNITTRAMYKLTGVICHIGSLHGGHYFAFCKNIENDGWLLCDDTNVSQVEVSEVLNYHNAYMLFYTLMS